MLLSIFNISVLIASVVCMTYGCYLLLTSQKNGGSYMILSMAIYVGFTQGFLAFGQHVQDESVWIFFPLCILICTGCIRHINGFSPVPKFRLDQRGKKVLNVVYKQIFISLVVFMISAIISFYGFGVSPGPTLKIGGTFSLITVAIPFAIGHVE